MKKIILISLLCVAFCNNIWGRDILIEAESFKHKGGWCLDNQSMASMGSSYLLAHGLGIPVDDAVTTFDVRKQGKYRMWVRTRDWVKTWGVEGSPGRFKVEVNGNEVEPVFGVELEKWHWQDGGTVFLKKGENEIKLKDLTGFDGRCDAVYFTSDLKELPPDDREELDLFRKSRYNHGKRKEYGDYDFVVVGGGIAGCCAAISAARLGCKVALIQNRPVLGGNNSSEVRVGLSGLISQKPYNNLGNLLDELGGVGHWTKHEATVNPNNERSRQIMAVLAKYPEKHIHNAGPAENYEDWKKSELIDSHENIDLFLNTHVVDVMKQNNRITAVIGRNIETNEESVFYGNLFADCTGDGDVGYLAGADFRMGREAVSETGEYRAPEKADSMVMGTSVQWYAETTRTRTDFPVCNWGVQFNDTTCVPLLRGDWDWETGFEKNQITEIEEIRDYALRSVYGNWSYLKNSEKYKEEYADKKLVWVAFIGGKRESRRLMGDVVLKEQDILNQVEFEDASFTTTWGVDLHFPKKTASEEIEPYLSRADIQQIKPYAVPYRCLYSRNIENLFMAGRNISVTHIALGSVRVMRTGGMMGEVIGMAASICKNKKTLPRGVYTDYLPELKKLMSDGVGKPGFSSYFDDSISRWSDEEVQTWLRNSDWMRLPMKVDGDSDLRQLISQYKTSEQNWNAALKFLSRPDLGTIAPGRYELTDDGVYATVSEYKTKDEALFEVHSKYTDIQYVMDGEEFIYISNAEGLEPSVKYNVKNDIAFYDIEPLRKVYMDKNKLLVLFPGEAHKPCIKVKDNQNVRKIVVKIPYLATK